MVKILSYNLILMAVLFTVLLVSNKNNMIIVGQLKETVDNNYKVYTAMGKTNESIKDVENYLFNDDESAKQSYLDRKKEVQTLIDDLYTIESSLESYFEINAIFYSVKAYSQYFDSAIEQKTNSDKFFYVNYYKGSSISKYTNKYFQDLLLEILKNEASEANALEMETIKIRKTSYNLIAIGSILALVIGLIISKSIATPIKTLSQYSKEISAGKLDVPEIEINTKEEIGDLSKAFNHMSKSIKKHITNVEEKANVEKKLHEEERAVMQMEQLLQQARFEALQARINPHFLFNTLNVISRTALFEDAHETMELIQSISKILRYQLKKAGEKATIKEEIEMILDYLAIQKVRFKERLQYKIDNPDDIDLNIPVLTLQPLVENAIIHGIEPRVNGGSVKISVRKTKLKTIIKIVDTGIGMSKEFVDEINSETKINKKNKVSIGVNNVKQRFLLSFPERSQFVVQSKKGLGTVVKMVIINEREHSDV